MFKPGDVCELKEGVTAIVTRDGEPVRLFPEAFTVGLVDLARGVIQVHRMGVKVEIPAEVFSYYHVVGSVGEYPKKKLDEKLDKTRSRWIKLLGDRTAEDCEVRDHIDRMNEVMTELIPPALGAYYYQFRGVYMDDMKRVPLVGLKWTPPTPGQPIERSHNREDNSTEHEQEAHNEPGPESGTAGPGGQGEASPEGPEGEAGVHALKSVG